MQKWKKAKIRHVNNPDLLARERGVAEVLFSVFIRVLSSTQITQMIRIMLRECHTGNVFQYINSSLDWYSSPGQVMYNIRNDLHLGGRFALSPS